MTDLLSLTNKEPVWNPETQSFVLDFDGRVSTASVKNFQIVHQGDPSYVILQFGRTDKNTFTMDYNFPLTAIQVPYFDMRDFPRHQTNLPLVDQS